ncbi:methyltransferase domain-containing protein [Ideonella livida]|uniref:Class I SAM-dependent methyltransferase n=1 Tax=Ideonella livida TaxID=2707176 RepID=A0A7C9PEX5_9BURK|nr:methyltransferase domain-containing protein [Ideonella livida]NDY89911.1 class I SAM-dependent methyltransferase [Ideonella livida]
MHPHDLPWPDAAPTPALHLCLLQPPGYVHTLGLVDAARYLRWQLRRQGASVSLAKNRLRHDAVNLVLGAHLLGRHPTLPPDLLDGHCCLVVNLEQLGPGGAPVAPDYLALLQRSAVVDYDTGNLAAYARDPADVPVIGFGPASYLVPTDPLPLGQRPIDLLFFGSLNERRRALLARIEAAGLQVTQFDHPLYAQERDHFIGQAKAVLNGHFYATSRFEQVRAFHVLSLGTPLLSERGPLTQAAPVFEAAVDWLPADDLALTRFLREDFGSPAWCASAQARLHAFAHDQAADSALQQAYAGLLGFAAGYAQAYARARPAPGPWRPRCINLGSGKDYRPGWLNLDILERTQPDLVLDLGQPRQWPLQATGPLGATVRLEAGSVDLVYANNVLEHVPDLPALMGNVLTLLREGGEFHIEVPYEGACTAWQDPTHVRALNEASWRYYTEWFWYLGWFEHRFETAQFQWLDEQLRPCTRDQAAFMKLTLRKVATTPRERTLARTLQPDFGGLPQDWPADPTPDTPPQVAPAAGSATPPPLQAATRPQPA